jgi:hypothetical protein
MDALIILLMLELMVSPPVIYSCDGRASGVATHCSSNVEDDGAKTRHSSNTAAASPGAGGVECTRACS